VVSWVRVLVADGWAGRAVRGVEDGRARHDDGGRPVVAQTCGLASGVRADQQRRLRVGSDTGYRAAEDDIADVKYARRTPLCRQALEHVGLALAGRAGSRLASRLGFSTGWNTLLRLVRALPDPEIGSVTVLGIDDFAIARGRKYATVVIDAVSHRRLDVLPDRKAETVAAWLREHPGVQAVCRDGSASYAEAIRQGAPKAVQVSDRWHLWHGLAAAVEKTVVAHSACWNTLAHRDGSALAARTRQRHAALHDLLAQGAGLLACARRLGWSLNTVKRYARADTAEELLRPPRYGPCLVDAHRDLVRERLAGGVPVTRILTEIREHGYTGSANLLVRYINQGRADPKRTLPSPRRLVSWIMSRSADLLDHQQRHLNELISSCPEMATLAARVREFAAILTQRRGQDLDAWMTVVRADALPGFDSYLNGLARDRDATIAGLSLPHSNGPTEGINNKIKMLKRQTYGRASFPLLRKRILLVE
jgi:hypothetical protein